MRSLWGCQWRGTTSSEPEQFSNFEYFTTHNYSLVWEKTDRSGGVVLDGCTCVCVWDYSPHHVCLIITPQSFLASLSLPPSLHPSCWLVKGLVPNKAHSHAERMWSSTNLHHNYIWFPPKCLFRRALSSLPVLLSLKHPGYVSLLLA